MQYSDYQNQASSEKIVLATLDASKRLMGWSLHSGSVYKLTGVTFPVIVSLEDSGSAYTEVGSLAAVVASSFYLDRDTATLYLRTTGSDHPNGRFLVATYRLFFANVPIALPWNLDSGFEVFWEPLVKANSAFGVEIDTINQTSEAIEGSGSLTLHNAHEFWPKNFDKLTFENKLCSIYSHNRELDATEAQLLFRGRVEDKTYTPESISFKLKDTLALLKNTIRLMTIDGLGAFHSPSIEKAFQRMVLGRVYGHRPTNIDEVNDGRNLTGTITVSVGSATVTGSGTIFLKELSPDDRLVINGTTYTVGAIFANNTLELTESFNGTQHVVGGTVKMVPSGPKRWLNRAWKVAGHALREPVMTTGVGSTTTLLVVDSTKDVYSGDVIYIGALGSGETATVETVVNKTCLRLTGSLNSAPLAGVTVLRPAVQNVRINDTPLVYYRDYVFFANTATLILRETAEINVSPVRQLSTTLSFTPGSRTVEGTGLDSIFEPGYMVSHVGQTDYFEVLSVTETTLTLRTACTFGVASTGIGLYKPFVFQSGDVLTCDTLGKTVDGTPTGALLETGPAIIKDLLLEAGMTTELDTASFDFAEGLASQPIGLVIPPKYGDLAAPTYRDVINTINKSVGGNLVQTNGFLVGYLVLQPNKTTTSLRLREEDILAFSVGGTSRNMTRTAQVKYQAREYDYLNKAASVKTQQTSSDTAAYSLKTDILKTFDTKLVDERDAECLSGRWALLLEQGAGMVSVTTKLQGAQVEVGDVIDIEHRKMFQRLGGSDHRRLIMVESVKKNGSTVVIDGVDLSNTFNRVATIGTGTTEYANATRDEKIYGGYITDEFGMISNDPETFGLNIIY